MTDPALLAEPDEPPPPRRRRGWLAALAVLVLLLVGLHLALPGLAGAWLRNELAAAGLPSPRLVVTSVGLHRATLVGLQLGTSDEVTIDKVVASYDPLALLGGRVRRLELRGMHVKASLDSGRVSLGSIDRALGGDSGTGGSALPPELSIKEGVLSLKLPHGLLAASFTGEFDRAADGRLTGQLGLSGTLAIGDFTTQLSGRMEAALGAGIPVVSLQLDLVDPHYGDARFAPGQLKLLTQETGGSAELHLGSRGDALELAATGQLARAAGQLSGTGHLALAAKPGAPVWRLLGLPPPEQGSLALSAELAGSLAGPGLSWRSVSWSGTLGARLDQVSWPGLAAGATGAGRVALQGRGAAVTATLPEDLQLAGALDVEPLQAMPLALRALLAGPLAATLRAGSRATLDGNAAAPLSLALDGTLKHGDTSLTYQVSGVADPSSFKGNLTAHLAVPRAAAGPATAEDLAADLAATLAVDPAGLQLRLTDGNRITARRLGLGGAGAGLDNLALPLQPGPDPLLAIAWSPGGAQIRHSLTLGPVRLAGLRLAAVPQGPLDLAWQGLSSSGATAAGGYATTLTLSGGSIALPKARLSASGLGVSATLAGDGRLQATLQGLRLVDAASPPAFVPLRLQGTGTLAGTRIDAKGVLSDEGNHLKLALTLQHDLAGGAGGVSLSAAPLAFATGGLQPRDLSPAYGRTLQEVEGSLGLSGKVSWKPGTSTTNMKLAIKNLSGRTPGLALQQLNGVVAFDQIWPPHTPPHQQLAAALADVGLPLTDLLVDFQLLPGPAVAIAGGSLKLAGGDVRLDPVQIGGTAGGVPALRLAVSGLDLQQLLALASIDGLDGTGSLSGEIPLRLDPAGMVIEGGRLAAAGPGRLSYAPGKPPAALQGGGESVSLALAALTDFRYDELRATLDRQAGGDVRIGMHVRGKNPSFYNGYPVELNFTLSGELDRILRRGLAGYRIPDSIRERLSTFGE
jgi:hypothetical protein